MAYKERENWLDRMGRMGALLALCIASLLTIGSLLLAEPKKPSDKTSYISTGYEGKLFDDSFVHTIDIVLPQLNWDYMVLHATEEQYVVADVIIDGERIEGVAIRPKGNSSLSAIQAQGSDRFSFKIEFDHYRKDTTYHGLDKLSLNNLGQDVSCMKDYLVYHMMNEVGVPAPLSSYTLVRLNGEDFGLYLAVEAIEDSFAYRNYGEEYGVLYKPECFMIDKVTPSAFSSYRPDEELQRLDFTTLGPGERLDLLGTFAKGPFEAAFGPDMEVGALRYVGEDEKRYQVFWDSSVFRLKKEDRSALVQALRTLNSEDYTAAIERESLIRYFLVHNYINNYDSYTGIFVHNYYLREHEGRLSLIPWDYNLSCGIFTMESAMKSFLGPDSPYLVEMKVGEAMDDGTSMVNYPIDDPTFTVRVEDRPLLAAVLSDEENLSLYHEAFASFLDSFFYSGKFEALFQMAREQITPYVEKGLTFYTPDHFERAVESVHDYCVLRTESISRQLAGTLPATKAGQKEDYRNLVDGSLLDLSSSVTFDSLVFGIGSEDVYSVLDGLAGDYPHTSEGLAQSVAAMVEDPKRIGSAVLRIVSTTPVLQRAVSKAVSIPLLFLLSLIVLLVVRKKPFATGGGNDDRDAVPP